MEGESQGPGLKVGRGTKTLESILSSGGNQAWCWEAELGHLVLLSMWRWDRRYHLSDRHAHLLPVCL